MTSIDEWCHRGNTCGTIHIEKKYLLKSSSIDKEAFSRVGNVGLVLSTLLARLVRAETLREGSKVSLEQSYKSHLRPEIKIFSSVIMVFDSREESPNDSYREPRITLLRHILCP